jgi:predicted Zn finger-like uncharacterized protein
MSLATRCSACGTMFRVVQDQLRVSEGWVRCGRCDAVFNALDALVDLDTPSPGAGEPAAAPSLARAAAPPGRRPEPEPEPEQEPRYVPDPDPGPDRRVEPFLEGRVGTLPPPGGAWDEPEAVAPDRAMRGAERLDPPAPPAPAAEHRPVATAREPLDARPTAGATAAPGFVRRAERDARWQSPAMRAALLGCAGMLLALLALQAVYHFRDAIAARSPAAAEWLHSACERWDCRIEAPRRIADVTLEGSSLSRLPDQAEAVKLSMNLRNRGSTALGLPAVELTLTDIQGQLIARRVLLPADLRVDPPVIAAGSELPVEVVLGASGRAINGYTVELFYP